MGEKRTEMVKGVLFRQLFYSLVVHGSVVGYGRVKRDFFPQIHICEARATAATREDNV